MKRRSGYRIHLTGSEDVMMNKKPISLLIGLYSIAFFAFAGCDSVAALFHGEKPEEAPPPVCMVVYNANGASGTAPASTSVAPGSVITLPNKGDLIYLENSFLGWNENQNGAGTTYASGASITVDKNITFYAQWIADSTPQYTVVFNANGATGGSDSASQTVYGSTTITIPGQGTLVFNGKNFTGWNTRADGSGAFYSAGDSLAVTGNIILFAQWENQTPQYTVAFDPNGAITGTPPAVQTAYSGAAISIPNQGTLVYTGKTFAGWNTRADGLGKNYAAGYSLTVTANITLYAEWKNPIALDAPGAPSVAPGSGSLTVTWKAVSGADSYEVWIAATDELDAAEKTDEVAGTSARITGLTNGATYYIWVKAKNPHSTSNFSPGASGTPIAALLWTQVADSPISRGVHLLSVGYGGGRFIAGGTVGRLAGSSNGTDWNLITDSLRFYVYDILYEDDKFVACGNTGTIVYSYDGDSWTEASNSTFTRNAAVNGLAYGNGVFVAGGSDNGKMALSTDGISWGGISDSTFGSSDINAITFGGDKFVAAGESGKMAYSFDGLSWYAVEASTFDGAEIMAITYAAGTFVAAGYSGRTAYSHDGINWTAAANPGFSAYDVIRDAAYGAGKFIAVGDNGKMAVSSNGINWTAISNTSFNRVGIRSITYGGGRFAAVGTDGCIAYTNIQE
jgi:hypothetical protein